MYVAVYVHVYACIIIFFLCIYNTKKKGIIKNCMVIVFGKVLTVVGALHQEPKIDRLRPGLCFCVALQLLGNSYLKTIIFFGYFEWPNIVFST